MLKIWSSWEKFTDTTNLTCNEALVIFFQRGEQTPWNCAISSETLKNPEVASDCINTAITEMINKSYPEYWTPKARALRNKASLLKQLEETNKFLDSLNDE